jgi:hypothetical protein
MSISREENYAITLLCIQRKRDLVNIHDKKSGLWPTVKKQIQESRRGVRTATLDPIIFCKSYAIERLAAPGLALGENLHLIKVDQLLGWRR